MKQKKPRPTFKELYERYYRGSNCDVRVEKGVLNIVFKGELVRIPSLKNRKMPGKNYTSPDYKARLKAMDALFYKAVQSRKIALKPTAFGILLVFVAGHRSRTFDLSGCVETIQDWLEPDTKRVGIKSKSRGWGVGVIENDSIVRPLAFHHSDLRGFPSDESRIMLLPMLEVDDRFLTYIEGIKA